MLAVFRQLKRLPLPIRIFDARLDENQTFLILARRRHALLNHERRLTSSGAHT